MPSGVDWPTGGGYTPACGPLLPVPDQILHQSIYGRRILISRVVRVVICRCQDSRVFPDVDVAFAMSRCCILPPRACVPPSMSSYLLSNSYYELVLNAMYGSV